MRVSGAAHAVRGRRAQYERYGPGEPRAASGVRRRRSRAPPGSCASPESARANSGRTNARGSRSRPGARMTIELLGLVVFGHHGYLEAERKLGQRFLVDLWVEVDEQAAASDEIEHTVDYRHLAALVREVFAGPERLLLEGLAGAVVDGVFERFPGAQSVRDARAQAGRRARPAGRARGGHRRAATRLATRGARLHRARREPRPARGDDAAGGRPPRRRAGDRGARAVVAFARPIRSE